MNKKELFKRVLKTVVEITDEDERIIMSTIRKTNIVDARYMLVYGLYIKGLYPGEISEMMGCTSHNIRYIINNIHSRKRCNRIFAENMNVMKQKIEKML